MIDWQATWHSAWSQLGLHPDPDCLPLLLAAYGQSQRHYHGQQHLAECLLLCRQHTDLARHPTAVAIALWFHDAVYDPLHHDNEQRSADWAAQVLLGAGADAGVVERVRGLILATRHAEEGADADTRLLLDIDLAILGADAARFQEYEAQIRAEYAHVPEAAYRQVRRAVLQRFAGRPRLYATPRLYEQFETRARSNLAQAIHRLGA